jgi:hypothetical protein
MDSTISQFGGTWLVPVNSPDEEYSNMIGEIMMGLGFQEFFSLTDRENR